MDQLGGGSWLGINDKGVVATVMNRRGTLGPQTGKHSRGELVLKALAHDSATAAAATLTELEPAMYRSFNLVVVLPENTYCLIVLTFFRCDANLVSSVIVAAEEGPES